MNVSVGLASPERIRSAMYWSRSASVAPSITNNRVSRLPWSASILRNRVSLDAFMAGSFGLAEAHDADEQVVAVGLPTSLQGLDLRRVLGIGMAVHHDEPECRGRDGLQLLKACSGPAHWLVFLSRASSRLW